MILFLIIMRTTLNLLSRNFRLSTTNATNNTTRNSQVTINLRINRRLTRPFPRHTKQLVRRGNRRLITTSTMTIRSTRLPSRLLNRHLRRSITHVITLNIIRLIRTIRVRVSATRNIKATRQVFIRIILMNITIKSLDIRVDLYSSLRLTTHSSVIHRSTSVMHKGRATRRPRRSNVRCVRKRRNQIFRNREATSRRHFMSRHTRSIPSNQTNRRRKRRRHDSVRTSNQFLQMNGTIRVRTRRVTSNRGAIHASKGTSITILTTLRHTRRHRHAKRHSSMNSRTTYRHFSNTTRHRHRRRRRSHRNRRRRRLFPIFLPSLVPTIPMSVQYHTTVGRRVTRFFRQPFLLDIRFLQFSVRSCRLLCRVRREGKDFCLVFLFHDIMCIRVSLFSLNVRLLNRHFTRNLIPRRHRRIQHVTNTTLNLRLPRRYTRKLNPIMTTPSIINNNVRQVHRNRRVRSTLSILQTKQRVSKMTTLSIMRTIIVRHHQNRVLFMPNLPRRTMTGSQITLSTTRFFLRRTTTINISMRSSHTLTRVIMRTTIVNNLRRLQLPNLRFNYNLTTRRTSRNNKVNLRRPPGRRSNRIHRRHKIRVNQLITKRSTLRSLTIITLFPIQLRRGGLPGNGTNRTKMFVTQRLIRVPIHHYPLLHSTINRLNTILHTRGHFVVRRVNHANRITISTIQQVVPFTNLISRFRRIFRSNTNHTFSNVMRHHVMGMTRPPILRTKLLTPIHTLILMSVHNQPRRPLYSRKIIILPRMNRLNRLIRIRNVSMPLPKSIQIRLLVVKQLSSPRHHLGRFLVPTTIFFHPTQSHRPSVTRTPSSVLPNLLIRLFVPNGMINPLRGRNVSTQPRRISIIILVPRVSVIRNSTIMMRLPSSRKSVITRANHLRRRLVSLMNRTTILTINVIRRPTHHLFRLNSIIIKRHFHIPHVSRLPRRNIILLRPVRTTRHITLSHLRRRFQDHFQQRLQTKRNPRLTGVLSVTLPFLPVHLYRPSTSPFHSGLRPFYGHFEFCCAMRSKGGRWGPTGYCPPPAGVSVFFGRG